MGLFFDQKYPYTDFHELNLDWLLSTYKQIKDSIDALNSWMSEHKTQYNEAMIRLAAVENEIDTFEAEINRRFASLDEAIHEDFNKLTSDILKELSKTQKQIEQELQAALVEFENEFRLLKAEVDSFIATSKMELNEIKASIKDAEAAAVNISKNYVDARLNAFIQELPDYEDLVVYNPIRTAYTNVQQAINDLYDHFRVFGLTAIQYDSLGLTASEYDAFELTAYDYDCFGYRLLHYPDDCCYMRSPFTGQIVKNKVVIYELAELHRQALTAQEYDDLELDADTYDAMQLTAYWYDWYGLLLRDAGITAADYDALGLTASQYDALGLTAILYDRFANALLNH